MTIVTKGTEVENKNDLDTTVHNAARIFSPIFTRNFFTLKGKLTILDDFFSLHIQNRKEPHMISGSGSVYVVSYP